MRLVLDARTAAFAALIDYAGLFPPASSPMSEAVETYRRIRSEDRAWVAGRFLCRASQLTDLAAVATSTFRAGETPWEIGVIFDLAPGDAATRAIDFRTEMDPVMTIGAAEAGLSEPTAEAVDSLLDAMLSVSAEVVPFVEVDTSFSIPDQVGLIASALRARRRVGGAKLRCGGANEEAFPTPGEVADFIMSVTAMRLPFKATAGLHRPIRHFDSGIGVKRHGFLNILMATALAESGMDRDGVESVIEDTDRDAFTLTATFASWRDHELPGSALRRMRRSGFVAYGSCDFDEPIEALESLGFLGGGS